MEIWEPKPLGNPLGHTGPVTGLLYLYLFIIFIANVSFLLEAFELELVKFDLLVSLLQVFFFFPFSSKTHRIHKTSKNWTSDLVFTKPLCL